MIDELRELIRRFLVSGLSILVVLASPGTDLSASVEDSARDEPRATAPADTGSDGADRTAGDASTAAGRLGWGRPNRVDQFTDGLHEDWNVYDGPGHVGNGRRAPSTVSVEDGVLTLTGDRSGTTGGMSWGSGQKYGRWEARVRAPAAAESYHALVLLWPDAEDFPVGGEIDFVELLDGDRQRSDLFIHYGEDNSQVHGEVEVDATTWHNWALEWTPDAITAYLDGEVWFRTTDTEIFPPGPMHLCIQLDWFPDDGRTRTSTMQVDWVKQYPLDS